MTELTDVTRTKPTDDTGGSHYSTSWSEVNAAGVGSPHELKFLREFEKHGFFPQKQVPVSLNDGETPISIADFAVQEKRLAIYIDEAAFHDDERLRRDRYIHKKLETEILRGRWRSRGGGFAPCM